MIHPQRLQEGDTIGIIAPASPPNQENLDRAIVWLEQLGFRIKLADHLKQVYGYLAGDDDERLADFHRMFQDPNVKAIVCARGGYGTARFAEKISIDLIKSHPKIFWGYSDITYLHTIIQQKAGLVTFHGPMLASDLGKPDVHLLSKQLFSQLFEPTLLNYDEHISPLRVLTKGSAGGILTGGNLSLLVSTLGTANEIDTKGKLLLIEDVDEEPYRVDSMLNQLRLAGKLQDASGFVIGNFHLDNPPKSDPSLTFDEVFETYLGSAGKPAMSGFMIGHCSPHFAVPLGAEAILDTNNKQLIIRPGVQ